MPLKAPQQYVKSLRDSRVSYWNGKRIDDVTTRPRSRVPVALMARGCNYGDSEYRNLRPKERALRAAGALSNTKVVAAE